MRDVIKLDMVMSYEPRLQLGVNYFNIYHADHYVLPNANVTVTL